MARKIFFRVLIAILLFNTACGELAPTPQAVLYPATLTPFQPVENMPTAAPPALWMAEAVPDELREEVGRSAQMEVVSARSQANVTLELSPDSPGNGSQSTWIYALVAAFPTSRDAASFQDVQAAWQGSGTSLIMTESTQAALEGVFGGQPAVGARLATAAGLFDELWKDRTAWAIVPFEALNERMKVLEIDGQSPIHKDFDLTNYPLKAVFTIHPAAVSLPVGNRDPQKLVTVMLTGTTALVRAISYKMQINGVEYPARDIGGWLRSADILHISNEASFTPACPAPDPLDGHLRFCSAEQNIGLLDAIGADVIELTGNHNNDWGAEAYLHSLDLFRQRGWAVYGGGENLLEARKPVIVERGGMKFAFIGCNAPGPDFAWATENSPGAAPCGDYGWMADEIRALKSEGATVFATLQHYEYYTPDVRPNQSEDFHILADAGADVVSGSQAHYAQAMEFRGGTFIHYGLGNLFFDQMGYTYPDGTRTNNTRREFLDRYVFYDGRLVSIELLTAMLEDYSRPRPMTPEERAAFLDEYLTISNWLP